MIEIKLFKFDNKTDYLPYYKSYKLEHNGINTIDDVLNKIYGIEKFGYIQGEPFFLRVNDIFLSSDTSISEILTTDSKELVIEPLSIKRAVHDLIIDTKDYQEKLNFLDAYMSESEKNSIIQEKTYMLEYYASNTLHFHQDYIGEHVILLGLDIVKKDNTLKDEIFNLLNCEDGIVNKTSLKYRILNYPQNRSSKSANSYKTIQSFENFNIALHYGLNPVSFEDIIEKSNANYIDLKSKHFDIPFSAKKLSYLIAGTVLLEALDNNADLLIVNTQEDISLFDAQQKNIEKAMGRDIGLPVLTRSQFIKLLEGEKDKNTLGLNAHKVKIEFLD